MATGFKPIRLQETPQILGVLADFIRDGKPGFRERFFSIESFRKHVFQEDLNNSAVEKHLRNASIYQKVKGYLVEAQTLLAQDSFDMGQKWVERAVQEQTSIIDKADLKVETTVYKAMKKQLDETDATTGKDAFNNRAVDLNKKKIALQQGIQEFENHWSTKLSKDIPEDIVASKALEEAQAQIQQLRQENEGLKKPISEKSGWGRLILKCLGAVAFIAVILDFFTYISQGTQRNKM